MAQTWRLLVAASACAVTVLYGGHAFALPHSFDYTWGDGGSDRYRHGESENDQEWGEDKKHHKYKKFEWDEHEPKKDWFTSGHDWSGGPNWGKDPDCDPMTPTPEPSTLLLVGSTLTAAGLAWRKRRARLPER
jgi:hypothetical protein